VYCIWLDEARARQALELAHATWATAALKAGAKKHEVGTWEDPADQLDGAEDTSTGRETDPAARAAQIRAFLTASGHAGDATTVT
jgi:hypothetical protein